MQHLWLAPATNVKEASDRGSGTATEINSRNGSGEGLRKDGERIAIVDADREKRFEMPTFEITTVVDSGGNHLRERIVSAFGASRVHLFLLPRATPRPRLSIAFRAAHFERATAGGS